MVEVISVKRNMHAGRSESVTGRMRAAVQAAPEVAVIAWLVGVAYA
jgi:hypothetical protein